MNELDEMPKNQCIMWTNLVREKKIILLYGGDNPNRKGIREEYEFDICLMIKGFSEDVTF